MLPTLEKWLSLAGSVISVLAGLAVYAQQSFWPGGPPHWVALVVAGLGVAGTVVAKLLELLSGTVQQVKGAALVAKGTALQLKAPGGK